MALKHCWLQKHVWTTHKSLWTTSGPWTMCGETLAKIFVPIRPYVCCQPQEKYQKIYKFCNFYAKFCIPTPISLYTG